MYGDFAGEVKDKVDLSGKSPAQNKLMDLKEAIGRFVRPGMHLHIAHTYLRPNAAIYEICRTFRGRDPRFVVSALGFTAAMVLFVSEGLARRLISSFLGDAYPFPGPNRIYQEAYARGKIEIENWTVLTLTQRLLAGALGVEWLPTHSLAGSSLEKENARDIWCTESPDGGKTLLIRALRPDITVLHAWAADPAGNLLISPPYAEGPHGVYAAREGAIATVEHLLATEELKKYAHFVKVPGYLVRAVCPAPLGAHPAGADNYGLKDLEAYAEDEEFIRELRDACTNEAGLKKWTEQWVFGVENHEAYLKRLGYKKIWHLKGKAASDSWISELDELADGLDSAVLANPAERLIINAAEIIKEKVGANGYRTVLAGIGAANLAAWKAWFDLRREAYPLDLMAEVGFFGYTPRPGDPFIFNFRNIPTCTMLADIMTVLGSLVGAESNRCLGVLGAGQIDREGNINSTLIPEHRLFLVGSGGACDVALGAKEAVVVTPISPVRLVEKVGYITAPGIRVRTLVTDRAVFEKKKDEATFTLTRLSLPAGKGELEALAEVRANCGWQVQVSPDLTILEEPSLSQLKDLRIFDPRRHFLAG